MPVSIKEIDNRLLSLEFEEEDIPQVVEAISNLFGKVTEKRFVMASEIAFGGATFTFRNEWQDPCLISSSREGHKCLRRIYEELNGVQT